MTQFAVEACASLAKDDDVPSGKVAHHSTVSVFSNFEFSCFFGCLSISSNVRDCPGASVAWGSVMTVEGALGTGYCIMGKAMLRDWSGDSGLSSRVDQMAIALFCWHMYSGSF